MLMEYIDFLYWSSIYDRIKKDAPLFVNTRGTPMPKYHANKGTSVYMYIQTHLASGWRTMKFGVFLCNPSLEDIATLQVICLWSKIFFRVFIPFRKLNPRNNIASQPWLYKPDIPSRAGEPAIGVPFEQPDTRPLSGGSTTWTVPIMRICRQK